MTTKDKQELIIEETFKIICSRCKRLRPTSSFNKRTTLGNGLQSYCKDCTRKYQRLNNNYRITHRKAEKSYIVRNPNKIRAHQFIARAVRTGKLAKLTCEVCGNFLSEAHHFDYSKPLEVWWLCKKHHLLADKGKLKLYE